MNKLFTYLLITAISFLIACSSNTKYVGKNSSISVDSTVSINNEAAQLIKPYKEKLDAEMNEVLVISSEEFPKEKGKAQTKLGNLVADLSMTISNKIYTPKDNHYICFSLLNFGGLRTSLPKGEITRGKIFELMPFENELVVLTLNKDSVDSLIKYLKEVGGQPISSELSLKFIKNQPSIESMNVFDSWEADSNNQPIKTTGYKNNTLKILTSDYLANGGDNMTFFANPIKYEKVGIKLRDAIIQYCQEQHQQGKQLVGKLDGRITFE